ncbi:MAG TPA: Crp/Fnr family transcriptional regulator [Nitrospira sp.]|nr:Crp/Fnr family transcriptional regulator [Nitrospira sp.]
MSTTVNLFRNAADVNTFTAGQVIFKEGQPGDVMYVVIEGRIDIVVCDKVINVVGPGGILGEMALLDKEPRSTTAIANTDCRLVPVDQKRFTFLVQQTPYFAIEVMQIMAERLRRLNSMLSTT